jgi:hypothetical protein
LLGIGDSPAAHNTVATTKVSQQSSCDFSQIFGVFFFKKASHQVRCDAVLFLLSQAVRSVLLQLKNWQE